MCEDLISRQEAIYALDGISNMELCARAYRTVKGMLKALPSAEPQRKKGRWIQNTTYQMVGSDAVVAEACCSECELYSSQINAFGYVSYDICPRCGAEMTGGE